jgi:ADP-ribosylation factor family
MGLWMSRLLNIFGEKEARILVLGLDNAGKTTILCESSLHIANFSATRWVGRDIHRHQVLLVDEFVGRSHGNYFASLSAGN